MTRRSHGPSSRRRTASTVPPSETSSSASTPSHAQADAETATSSSAAVGIPAADLLECKTLGGGRISREVWLLILDRAVPPPPRTTLEQDTRDRIMELLALVNEVWRAEILRRKARSALLYIDVPLIRSDLWFLDRWVKQRHDLGAKYADGVRSPSSSSPQLRAIESSNLAPSMRSPRSAHALRPPCEPAFSG